MVALNIRQRDLLRLLLSSPAPQGAGELATQMNLTPRRVNYGGIRLCLARPHLLRQQARAILRAAAAGPLRNLFPMVADLREWRRARDIVTEVQPELQAVDVELGIIVGVCGQLGADAQAVPVLVSLGADELSVSVPAILTVKAQVRGLSLTAAQQLAREAPACATAVDVRRLMAAPAG